MMKDNKIDQAAEQYVRAHAIDGRSVTREHLDYLLNDLHVPSAKLAEILRIPKWLLARISARLGFHISITPAKGASKFARKTSYRIGDELLYQGSAPRSRLIKYNKRKYGEQFEKGREYIAAMSRDRKVTLTEGDLRYLYHELGLPLRHIASLVDRTQTTIHNWIKAAGISQRSTAETKSSHYNTSFFRTWSPVMAWVLGLLYTDGNMSRGRVTLSSIDTELLEKVRAVIAPKGEIYVNHQSYDRTRTISIFAIAHREMVNDLRSLGLQENKSLIMTFPEVPEEFVRHFVRGCWDGDGGFTKLQDNFQATYTCGSIQFITRLAGELFKSGIGRLRQNQPIIKWTPQYRRLISKYGRGPYPLTIHKRRDQKAYEIKIASREVLARLYDYFYRDVARTIYLARKHQLLAEFLGEET